MNNQKTLYCPNFVNAHGSAKSTMFLVNEAPGFCETYYGIPLIGSQGGNIYRALRKSGIAWARGFKEFSWPTKIESDYKNLDKVKSNFKDRDDFVGIRSNYITCTNSYSYLPYIKKGPNVKLVKPESERILSESNIERLAGEVSANHRVILICGECAWLACYGSHISNPAKLEGLPIKEQDLLQINSRISANFTEGWYMGHTRRWSLNSKKTSCALCMIAAALQWRCCIN